MGIDAVKRPFRRIVGRTVCRRGALLTLCALTWCAAAPRQAAPAAPRQTPSAPQQAAPPSQPAPPAPEQTTFRTQPVEVVVPVTVTDEKGRFVSDLKKDDFRILDEGKPQVVNYFNHDSQQPVVVGFLVDLSSHSRTHWTNYKDAARELIYGLMTDDKKFAGYLITYANEAELAVDTTTDGAKLADRLEKVRPGGGSALFDAIYQACTTRKLVPGEPYDPRRIIVIIGDGHNNSSSKSLDEVLELAKRNQVTIFGVSTVAYGFDNDSRATLERLATETGGRVEYPLGDQLYKGISGFISQPMDAGNYVYEAGTGGYASEVARALIAAVTNVVGNVQTQYILRYVPDVDPAAAVKPYRRIKVDIPSLPNVRVSTKDGYFPTPLPATATGLR